MKPRLRLKHYVWSCSGYHAQRWVMGYGYSPRDAWDDWLANCWSKKP